MTGKNILEAMFPRSEVLEPSLAGTAHVISEVSVAEAWEIIFFSTLSAFLLRIKNSMSLLTKSECFESRCRISRDGFIASFHRTVAQMTH